MVTIMILLHFYIIPLDNCDYWLIGKIYHDGRWEENTDEIMEEPTESEIAQAEILLTQHQIMLVNQKNLDETMAQALPLIVGRIQNV